MSRAGVIRGDARALPLSDSSVQCVVTSPPYNVGIDYDGYNDVRPWEDYWADVDAWSRELYRVCRDGARVWVNVVPTVPLEPNPPGDHSGRCSKERTSLLVGWASALVRAGFGIWDTVAWCSARGPGTAWGSWRSPAAPNMRGEWESLIVAHRGTWARETPDGFRNWKDDGEWTRLTSNVWRVQPQPRSGHPAPFPPELASRCIRLSTWPGELVLDPFAGSGATLRAAMDLGRRGVGLEQSERYCGMARAVTAQSSLFGEISA